MCWSSTTPTCSNVRSIQHDPNTTPARSTRYPHAEAAFVAVIQALLADLARRARTTRARVVDFVLAVVALVARLADIFLSGAARLHVVAVRRAELVSAALRGRRAG